MFIIYLCIQGSLIGLITGLIITLWVGIGSQIYPPSLEKTRPLPLSVAGCDTDATNITTTMAAWSSTALPTTESRQIFFSRFHLQGFLADTCFLLDTDAFLYLYVINLKQQHLYITSFAVTFTAWVHSVNLSTKCTSYLSFSIVRPALADSWYSLSYLYFCPMAMLVTMSTGLIFSAITCEAPRTNINSEMGSEQSIKR